MGSLYQRLSPARTRAPSLHGRVHGVSMIKTTHAALDFSVVPLTQEIEKYDSCLELTLNGVTVKYYLIFS